MNTSEMNKVLSKTFGIPCCVTNFGMSVNTYYDRIVATTYINFNSVEDITQKFREAKIIKGFAPNGWVISYEGNQVKVTYSGELMEGSKLQKKLLKAALK